MTRRGRYYTYTLTKPRKSTAQLVYLIKPNGEKWFDKPMSQKDLAKESGICHDTINRSYRNKQPLKYSGRAKYDPKYIGSYVVDADEWNNKQNELN